MKSLDITLPNKILQKSKNFLSLRIRNVWIKLWEPVLSTMSPSSLRILIYIYYDKKVLLKQRHLQSYYSIMSGQTERWMYKRPDFIQILAYFITSGKKNAQNEQC